MKSALTQKWPELPESEIRRLQADKLRHYLRDTVLPFSVHYQKLFQEHNLTADSIRTLDDLRRIPFTSKLDLLNTPENPQKSREFILIPDQKVLARRPGTILRALLHGKKQVKRSFELEFRPIFMTSTTGRSSDPVPFVYSQHDLDNLSELGRRVFEICECKTDYRLVNMFPYAPHLAFWLTHYGGQAFDVFVASTGGGKVMGTEGNLRMIKKINPNVLIGMPTFVYHVLHQAAEEDVRCDNLCRIVVGGEKLPDGMRRKLISMTRALGAKNVDIVATYGFTEAKTAWPECPCPPDKSTSGFHLYPDYGIVEVVDPQSGEPVAPGNPGEIVFTPLESRGSVVLRYRTGDFTEGGLTYEPCPHCGRSVPRLFGNISRKSEIKEVKLDKIRGTLVDFNQLEHVLDDAAFIGAWQLELRKFHDDPMELDELVLHVHKLDGIADEKLIHSLNSRFLEQTEIHPNRVIFHTADEMAALQGVGKELKEQKIVDHRPSLHQSGTGVTELDSSNGLSSEPETREAA